tara:strand:+ start:319 stop:1641 length:1323 start_codon:yes stop_codon:yes gene_type:complete
MNILEVQDALKDFSQDQLVNEMQAPSGQAPQFLVLSELNRRQRMKQDFDARQAQQQPTVAEKLVAAAGAPQGGIGAMAQSMAPQTDMAMNTGISQMEDPMSGEVMEMNEGGFLSSIKNRYVDPTGDLKYGQILGDASMAATVPLAFTPVGLAGRALYTGARYGLPALLKGQAVKGAGSKLGSLAQKLYTKPKKRQFVTPYGSKTVETGGRQFDPKRALALGGFGGTIGSAFISDPEEQSQRIGEASSVRPEMSINPATGKPYQSFDEMEAIFKDAIVPTAQQTVQAEQQSAQEQKTTQDRIMDLMEQRQKSADMDKYLSLAQAGFTLMQPTEGGFGEALGKAGVAGIQAYQDASDRYQTGLADVLDTEIALQKASASSDTTIDEINALVKALAEANEATALGESTGIEPASVGAILMQKIARLEGNQSSTTDFGSLAMQR